MYLEQENGDNFLNIEIENTLDNFKNSNYIFERPKRRQSLNLIRELDWIKKNYNETLLLTNEYDVWQTHKMAVSALMERNTMKKCVC